MKIHLMVALICCRVFYRQVSCGVVITADEAPSATQKEAAATIEEIKTKIDDLPKEDAVDAKIDGAPTSLLTELQTSLDEPKQKIEEIVTKVGSSECYKAEDLENIPTTFEDNLKTDLESLNLSEQKGKITAEINKHATTVDELNTKLKECDGKDEAEKENCYQEIVDGKADTLNEVETSNTAIEAVLKDCDSLINEKKDPQLNEGKNAITDQVSSITNCLIEVELTNTQNAQDALIKLPTDFAKEITDSKEAASKSINDELPKWVAIYNEHKSKVMDSGVNIDECLIIEEDLTKLPDIIATTLGETATKIVDNAKQLVTDSQELLIGHTAIITDLKDKLSKCEDNNIDCIIKVENDFNTEPEIDFDVLVDDATTKINEVKLNIQTEQDKLVTDTKSDGTKKANSIETCVLKSFYEQSNSVFKTLNEAVTNGNETIANWKTTIGEAKLNDAKASFTGNVDKIKVDISTLEEQAKEKDISKCLESKSELDVLVTKATNELDTNWAENIDAIDTQLDGLKITIGSVVNLVNIEGELTKCKKSETDYDFPCIEEFTVKLNRLLPCKENVEDMINIAENIVKDEIKYIGDAVFEVALIKAQEIGGVVKSCIEKIINGGLIVVPSLLCLAIAASIQFMVNN